MQFINKSLRAGIIVFCSAAFCCPTLVYALGCKMQQEKQDDFIYGTYFNPYVSPYYFSYPTGNLKEQPNNFYPKHYVATSNPLQPKAEVTQAQTKLQKLGLYDGEVDGLMGPQTAEAITKFQQKKGLPKTGTLDHKTLKKLGIDN